MDILLRSAHFYVKLVCKSYVRLTIDTCLRYVLNILEYCFNSILAFCDLHFIFCSRAKLFWRDAL